MNSLEILAVVIGLLIIGFVTDRVITRRRRIRYIKSIGLYKHLYPD